MIWEQELYTSFKYNAVRPFFHTFAADVSKKYNKLLHFTRLQLQLQECPYPLSLPKKSSVAPPLQQGVPTKRGEMKRDVTAEEVTRGEESRKKEKGDESRAGKIRRTQIPFQPSFIL